MKAVINDISFEYVFNSNEEAISAFHRWLDICKEISRKKVRRVQEIYGNRIDTTVEIAPDYKIIQLVQEFKDREDRRRLLGILLNSRTYPEQIPQVYIDEKCSRAATFAYEDGILISLVSSELFSKESVEGKRNDKLVTIDNLASMEHIHTHSEKLGIRYFEHNKKHARKSYVRTGGTVVSEMDLSDEMAQQVLDNAVEINGHLYGWYNEFFYEFRKTEKNIYHCYKNESLSKELKKKILNIMKG